MKNFQRQEKRLSRNKAILLFKNLILKPIEKKALKYIKP